MAALGAANGAVGPDGEFLPFVAARVALSRGAIPGDITSIAALGSSLFVGTSKGRIVRVDYRTPDPTASPPGSLSPTRVCPEVTVASGYPVTRLIAITRRRLLLAVAGGTLALFEPGDDSPVLRYTNSSFKASQACVDERPSGEVMVAVLCPGQVKLLRLEGFAFTERIDISTPGKVVSLELVGERVALAYVLPAKEYNIVDTADLGKVKTVVLAVDKRDLPVLARTGPEELVATTRPGGSSHGGAESMGIFLTRSGDPAHRPPITWASAPSHVVVCAPYVLGVTGKDGDVYVHWHSLPTASEQQGGPSSRMVGRLMQRIPLRTAPVAACDASAGCLGRRDGRNPVFIAGASEVFALLPQPHAAQSTALLSAGVHEAAEELAVMVARAEQVEAASASGRGGDRGWAGAAAAAASAGSRLAFGRGAAAAAAAGAAGRREDEDEASEAVPVDDAIAASWRPPPPLPAPVEAARRTAVLLSDPPPPLASAPAEIRDRALALAGVAPDDLAMLEALAATDARAAEAACGPRLCGSGLPASMRAFHQRAGCVLLLRLQFDAALRHLCLSGIDPREVTSLFPGALHPAGFSFAGSVLSAELLAGVVDGTRSPAAAAEPLGEGEADLVPFAVSSAGGAGAAGMEAIIRAVREQQRAAGAEGGRAAGGRSSRRDLQPLRLDDVWGAAEMAALQRRAAAGRGRKRGEEADSAAVPDTSLLRDAMAMVAEFLLQRRQQHEPAWDSARAREALDTALCRALTLTGRAAELCAVLARESDVNLEDATAFLAKQGMRHALALLLRSRGANAEALAEWERIATASAADRTAAKLLEGDWLAGLVPKGASLEAAAERLALACTFETLRTADDVDALRRGLGWVLERFPITALSVACTPRRISLPAVELLSLLQQAQSERSLARKHPELLFRSLPHRLLLHLVLVVGSRDQYLHTALATDLAEAVLRCRGETPGGEQRGGSAAAAAASSAAAAGLRATAAAAQRGASASEAAAAGLRTIEGTSGPSGKRAAPGEEEGIAGELRRDLLQLLRWSRFYDPRKLSAIVAGTTLDEERVLLHSRAGEHEAALRVCLLEMGDLPRAEAYCVEAFAASPGSRDGETAAEAATLGRHAKHNPFLVLFTLLLDGLPGTGPMRHEALGLMERHAGNVAVRQALDVLPSDIPVAKMRRLLRRMIPTAETRWRQARVAQQVAELDRLETNVALTRAQRHYAVVDRDTVCAESGQRVQGQPFVLRAPPSAHVLAESKLVRPVLQSALSKRR
ncbi:hypothetical protein FNF31_05256 [Cafeteria roenbergensis]|uniref:CNH domain-containing protein n=1 Tax=Cafeteria roenbergensis TaxID=33653 RepID=A0A5A8D391_CAFRO|nr:hypothetical protein FNF31_05256 [Cafeteria roenbergensis]